MNYIEVLNSSLSKKIIDEICLSVINDETKFEEIFNLQEHINTKIAWRASWACEKIIEKKPQIINLECYEKIIYFSLSTKHDGQRRLLLSIIYNLQPFFPLPVPIINKCFEWMISDIQPIAVQCLSLKILTRYCKIEPDFRFELLAYLENFGSTIDTPAMKSTCNKALKSLNIKK